MARRINPVQLGPYPNRIKEMRQALGMSQEELGDKVGLTYSAIGKLERGMRRLRSDQLPRFAEALGCRPTDLLPDSQRLSPRKQALLDLLDELDEEDQDTLLRLGNALPKSRRGIGKIGSGRA